MPPKKRAVQGQTQLSLKEKSRDRSKTADESVNNANVAGDDRPSNKRRKVADPEGPKKVQRRSGRGARTSQSSQVEVLKFLLSRQASELCRPEDDIKDIQSCGSIRTYSTSVMTLFQELMCAVILSRPISYRLGLRTIQTLLNDPYNFASAKAVKEAGHEKHRQALCDARTQHKDKTAEQIGLIADVIPEKFTSASDTESTQLEKVRVQCDEDFGKGSEALQASIKGLGKAGLNFLFRRVHWLWPSAFPCVDDRTAATLKELGLLEDGEELVKLLEQCWPKLETEELDGDDEAKRKRRAFVVVLERATASGLEGKMDAMFSGAAVYGVVD